MNRSIGRVTAFLAIISSLSIVGMQRSVSAEPLRVNHERLECVAELEKGVFQSGEPLLVGVRLWNRDDQSQYFPDCWSILIEHVIVTDQTGEVVPYLGTRPAWVKDELRPDPIEWRPGQDRYAGQFEIGKAYGVKYPGEYRIRVRYPLTADASSFVVSAEVAVLAVPAGSIVTELVASKRGTPSPTDGTLPVRLVVRNRLDPAKVEVSGITFTAAQVGGNTYLWGLPGDQRDGRRRSLSGKVTELRFDLDLARWGNMWSSEGPSQSMRAFASPGGKWSVTAELTGLYQGRKLKVSSNPVVIEIGNPPTALDTNANKAAALWAAGSSRAGEEAQPKAFNSAVAFHVWAVISGSDQFVGRTPSEVPLTIPPCQLWYVEPLRPVDMAKVRQEVEAQKIPGLKVDGATDADLEHLKGLTGLERLDLDHTKVTDAGLVHLKGLTALQWLELWGTQVTDAGLEDLKGLQSLQRLSLSYTQVTDAGLAHLKGLTALQGLYLMGTQVTDAGLVHLRGLKALQYLNVVDTKVTDAGVEDLRKSLLRVTVWRHLPAKRVQSSSSSQRG